MPLYTQTRGNFFSAAQVVAGGSYEAESSLIFAAFTTPPDDARKTLINACVLALKTAGVWAKLDVLYMLAAADSQAALINWINPGTYNATLVNSPTFAADQGFTGASTKYIDMNFNAGTAPAPHYIQDSATAFGRVTTNQQTLNGFVGDAVSAVTTLPRHTTDVYSMRVNTTIGQASAASADSIGFWAIVRTASNAQQVYKNGSGLGTSAAASTGVPGAIRILLAGAADYYVGTVASAGLGAKLDATEHLALYNADRAYATGVGIP